tara:strand:+ start:8590 stop:8880 length:291 start_codon:yes stop_codon:yes gene_type:complete
MLEFIIGLALGLLVTTSDLGEPVPYQTITYTDSGRVVKIYNTSAFRYRYLPNSYATSWDNHDFRYWDTRHMNTPVYTKSIVINKKPKPKPKTKDEE